jgi:thiamine biosynthesis lipoprotein
MTADVLEIADWSGPSLGGRLAIAIAASHAELAQAEAAARRVGRRVDAWANRLTRFNAQSDLSRLNDRGRQVRQLVRPTLGSVLCWATQAWSTSSGIVDVTLLENRLAAETVPAESSLGPATDGYWSVKRAGRADEVNAPPGVRFDLDGVAKGWLADRANDLLARWPASVVNADGDISLAASGDAEWLIDVVNPAATAADPLATLRFSGMAAWRRTCGVATSGTTIHRWRSVDGRLSHHLIDPRSGLPAVTDVIQATVVAPTAREAEVMSKTAVILGSQAGTHYLERSAAQAGLLLLESGELVSMPGTNAWLA